MTGFCFSSAHLYCLYDILLRTITTERLLKHRQEKTLFWKKHLFLILTTVHFYAGKNLQIDDSLDRLPLEENLLLRSTSNRTMI
jgi:hypothetical protein